MEMASRFGDFFRRVRHGPADSGPATTSPGRSSPISKPTPPSPARVNITECSPVSSPKQRKQEKQNRQFTQLLSNSIVDLDRIREISWQGIPYRFRARVWRLFLDYEPINSEQAPSTLAHKRKDYFDCLSRLVSPSQKQLWTSAQRQTLHQISIDLPRTPLPLLRNERIKTLFEHVLFVWAVRHPASGYVQGMNDILLPFFYAFISDHLPEETPESVSVLSEISDISDEVLMDIEADCFWCFGKLLDGIQDVFTKDQPGLYRMMDALEQVIQKVEPALAEWMNHENIKYCDFAFRWMNCLLVREFSLPLLFRVWDLFMSDHAKITQSQVYLCAAMLGSLSQELVGLSAGDFIMKIQNLGPDYWTLDLLETLLAQAFVYEKMFAFGSSKF
jgi:hypothetical protein